MNINTSTITPNGIVKALEFSHAVGFSPMFWGSPGVGKTSGIRQYAEYAGKNAGRDRPLKIYYIQIANYEAPDIRGQSIPDISSKRTVWLHPEILPVSNGGENDDEPGIIFFDEINRGDPRTQAALFELLGERTLGDNKYGPEWLICAAGNPAEYSTQVYEIDYALLDRIAPHYYVKPSYQEWSEYLIKNGTANSLIMSFVSKHKSLLGGEELRQKNDNVVGTNPRSLERLCKLFNAFPTEVAAIQPAVNNDDEFKSETVISDDVQDKIDSLSKAAEGLIGSDAFKDLAFHVATMGKYKTASELMEISVEDLPKHIPVNSYALSRLMVDLPQCVSTKEDVLKAYEIINAIGKVESFEMGVPSSEIRYGLGEVITHHVSQTEEIKNVLLSEMKQGSPVQSFFDWFSENEMKIKQAAA